MRSDRCFFRHALLRAPTTRYAVMLPPAEALARDQKYDERRGYVSDKMIRQHLAGVITLAVPAAVNGQAHLLPLDVDAGGLAAIRYLIDAAHRRGLWAFGQYCPRPDTDADQQRGYVWLPFEALAEAERLQLLGSQLIAAVAQTGWQIESRCHAAVTRLPLARHTYTGAFGQLVLSDQLICIDNDPAAAYATLRQAFVANPVASLPALVPPLPAPRPSAARSAPQGGYFEGGVTIDHYNQSTDLVGLLVSYGARPAKGQGSRRLLHCCGHADERRASLLLWKKYTGQLCCKCLSEHSNCPLAGQMRDAFGVYCAMEGLSVENALRRLNGKAER